MEYLELVLVFICFGLGNNLVRGVLFFYFGLSLEVFFGYGICRFYFSFGGDGLKLGLFLNLF